MNLYKHTSKPSNTTIKEMKCRIHKFHAIHVAAIYFVLAFLAIFNFGCKKTTDLAVIKTEPITNITASSASCGGYIINTNNSDVTERGVCWSTFQNPTYENYRTSDGTGKGKYVSRITDLAIGITYYVRAYAINEAGISYGKEISFVPEGVISDIDGNIYTSVIIGTQVWMVENLKTTRYNDGTSIINVEDPSIVHNTLNRYQGSYSDYDNNPLNGNIYGHLYNGYAAQSNKICPSGWHIPTDEEWTKLTDFLGGENIAGGKLKESGTNHWSSGNVGTNSSGFNALPGGDCRYHYDLDGNNDYNTYEEKGNSAYFWSSTGSDGCYFRSLNSGDDKITRNNWTSLAGMSLRCIHD